MEHLSFLFAAFAVTWIGLFLYVYSLWQKQDRIEKGLQRLQDQLHAKE